MAQIHPQAVVEAGAKIGKKVQIGPFSYIGANVTIDDDVVIKSHVCIDGHTHVHQGATIWPQAVIGSKTQDLKFRGETTYIEIGKKTEIRECVTINGSCGEGTVVKVGDSCLIMAYCHVAHNCTVGNRVIMANGATLAGHVTVEDCAVIGGLSAVHQFSRVGSYAMIGGMSRVTHDVPPFTIGAGSPYRLGGLNLIGLKRHGIPLKTRKILAHAFRLLYRSGLSLSMALNEIQNSLEPIPEILYLLDFCRGTKRGLIAMEGITAIDETVEQTEDESDVLETASSR